MKNIEKSITKIEKDINEAVSIVQDPANHIVTFIKEHKKILIIGTAIYLAYRYLFQEDD